MWLTFWGARKLAGFFFLGGGGFLGTRAARARVISWGEERNIFFFCVFSLSAHALRGEEEEEESGVVSVAQVRERAQEHVLHNDYCTG